MSKFHSTLSRREFMKALGMGAAGVGVAGISTQAPVFHDLDELTSSEFGDLCHPWWVKQVDKPTVEIDWDLMEPYKGQRTRDYDHYCTKTPEYIEGRKRYNEFKKRRSEEMKKGLLSGKPEYLSLRTQALQEGGWFIGGFGMHMDSFEDFRGWGVKTPQERGVPRYEGTPEENARTVRAAMMYYGYPYVGFGLIDENTKKLMCGRHERFEDVEWAYRDMTVPGPFGWGVNVYPEKCRYKVNAPTIRSIELSRYGAAPLKNDGILVYSHGHILLKRSQCFIKALGYQALAGEESTEVAWAGMCGIGELGRHSMLISPEWGTRINRFPNLTTDMVLPPSGHVDAGIRRFCKDCKVCSDFCHENALGALPEDREPTWEVNNEANRIGIKQWSINWPICCCDSGCFIHCVFNANNIAAIHDIVKATVSTTPIFNGFFANMDRTFNYHAEKDFADWWNRDFRHYRFHAVRDGDNRHVWS